MPADISDLVARVVRATPPLTSLDDLPAEQAEYARAVAKSRGLTEAEYLAAHVTADDIDAENALAEIVRNAARR